MTHQYALYDSLVRKSLEDGYMTEEELVIGRYVSEYCSIRCPAIITFENERGWQHQYDSHILEACCVAAREFGTSVKKAREFHDKSLEIRARNMNL